MSNLDRPSNFHDALKHAGVVCCPKCGACDIEGAKPTLEREQDGSLTCSQCATNFKESHD